MFLSHPLSGSATILADLIYKDIITEQTEHDFFNDELCYKNVKNLVFNIKRVHLKEFVQCWENGITCDTDHYTLILVNTLLALKLFLFSHECDYISILHEKGYFREREEDKFSIQLIVGLKPKGFNLSLFSQLNQFYSKLNALKVEIEIDVVLEKKWHFCKELFLCLHNTSILDMGQSGNVRPFYGWSQET